MPRSSSHWCNWHKWLGAGCFCIGASGLAYDVGIVGGGPAGTYAAMRLGQETGKNICVFEREERLGGRILSLSGLGSKGDLVVDAGAYRFARHKTTAAADTNCV